MGLGNPGRQYEKNRHNAGFLFLDYLLGLHAGSWANESKFHGIVANTFLGKNKVMLLKPQTFMNRSGLAVSAVTRFYKYSAEEVLVIHDELDLDVGVVKLKKGGGHAGHNGLRDIMASLSSKDFYRIRLGVGRSTKGIGVADYVLSNFYQADLLVMDDAYNIAGKHMEDIVSGKTELAMNAINRNK